MGINMAALQAQIVLFLYVTITSTRVGNVLCQDQMGSPTPAPFLVACTSQQVHSPPETHCSNNCQCDYGCIPDASGTRTCSPPPSRPTIGTPLVLTAGKGVLLAKSFVSELLTLAARGDKATVPAGRSYDGYDWEGVFPLNLSFDCATFAPHCLVVLPLASVTGHDSYILSVIPAPPLTPSEEASRLLTQGTFGPTASEITTTSSLSSAQWVWNQMRTAPQTSLRQHYRRRTGTQLRSHGRFLSYRDPCDGHGGSRWRRHAFALDDVGLIVTNSTGHDGRIILKVDGAVRTEVDQWSVSEIAPPFVICYVNEHVGGDVILVSSLSITRGMECDDIQPNVVVPNPPIEITEDILLSGMNIPNAHLIELNPSVPGTRVLSSLQDPQCSFAATGPIYVRGYDSNDFSGDSALYLHDQRMVYTDNTPESSTQKPNGISKFCPSAPKSFLNEDTCYVGLSHCSPPRYSSVSITLDAPTLRQFHTAEGLYVYKINGLSIQDSAESPCDGDSDPFRFIRRNIGADDNGCADFGGDTQGLDPTVTSAIKNVVTAAWQARPDRDTVVVLDVVFGYNVCNDNNRDAKGIQFEIPGAGCWVHSHPSEWNVYEFSSWVLNHDGNNDAFNGGRRNPIAAFAEDPKHSLEESVTLNFPGWHPKDRFDDRDHLFTLIGAWGDTVDFAALDTKAQGPKIAAAFGAEEVGLRDVSYEVCGSPGEVANEPVRGNIYNAYRKLDKDNVETQWFDQEHYKSLGKQMVWATVIFHAIDQLRHRVAWALSSIFIVTSRDINNEDEVESWSAYYDIFTRHAFGQFGDILKEVSYSPIMGEMLTYEKSRSLAYSVEKNGVLNYPDENYAREIMQLFSIGMWQLNRDGTKYLKDGAPVPTYNNDDITNFARAWTGFEEQAYRANIESDYGYKWPDNKIDPMRICSNDYRDYFPKMGLNDRGTQKYVGDGIRRCDALPPRSFLRTGARYRFLGRSRFPELARADPSRWEDSPEYGHIVTLNPTFSNLYRALCDKDVNTGWCQFRSTVVLNQNIDCYGSCTATEDGPSGDVESGCECSIDEPRVIKMYVPYDTDPVYYEYVPPPCVQMAFTENNFVKAVGEIGSNDHETMCADTRLAVAAPSCCELDDNDYYQGRSNCIFRGERVNFDTAKARCAAEGKKLCPTWTYRVRTNMDCGTDFQTWGDHPASGIKFAWSDSPCTIKAQIDDKGQVAIIHKQSSLSFPEKKRVSPGTGTYFKVFWSDNSYPKVSNCPTDNGCEVRNSTCLCDVMAETFPVFDGSFAPTVEQLVAALHIGAPDPATFDDGVYDQCNSAVCGNLDSSVIAYVKVGSSEFDEHTIFKLVNSDGTSSFLSNTVSIVNVGGLFSFRNPPSYNSPVDPTRRDAYYETDAVLDGYVAHSNTAPFISRRLIQSLITSNPSPRYIDAVSTAFQSGKYVSDGLTFGNSKYGNLEATVAAIMLDREARSSTLDVDATFGSAREPLLKVLHFMRAMELDTVDSKPHEITFESLDEKLGQEVFNAPSVFSFFLPDFQPVGPVMDRGLVAPATMLFDSPKLVGFINALASLPLYGLTDCYHGLGTWRTSRYIGDGHDNDGSFSCRQAEDYDPLTKAVPMRLRWLPSCWGGDTNVNGASAADVVEELDLLLTGGRLHEINKGILEVAYNDALAAADDDEIPDYEALRRVQQLFPLSPEFQVTNVLIDDVTEPEVRNVTVPTFDVEDPIPVENYKAIVYIFLGGAMDSYSAIVPKSGCTSAPNLVQQYYDVRGDVAIDQDDLHTISAETSGQPCDFFGVHPSLRYLKDLYNSGEAAFIANMGPLVEPITKQEYMEETKQTPESLFAHNTQTAVTQTVYAQDASANGVLGRMGDVINSQEGSEIFDSYSISGSPRILEGAPGVSRIADVLDSEGIAGLTSRGKELKDEINDLNMHTASSMFGETFSDRVTSTLSRIDALHEALGSTALVNGDCAHSVGNTYIAKQLQQVARVINSRDALSAKRDVFYVSHGGYDTHSDNGPRLAQLLREVNDALSCFVQELKAQDNIWNNVTVIQASEFARTLTSNGLGTDHGWGGNYFVLGGSIRGGTIHGSYPFDLTEDGPFNIGRGRLIPTTPWEAVWKPVAKWFGVKDEYMHKVLPNLANFGGDDIFPASELYTNMAVETRSPTVTPVPSQTLTSEPTLAPTVTGSLQPSTSVSVNPSPKPSPMPTTSGCVTSSVSANWRAIAEPNAPGDNFIWISTEITSFDIQMDNPPVIDYIKESCTVGYFHLDSTPQTFDKMCQHEIKFVDDSFAIFEGDGTSASATYAFTGATGALKNVQNGKAHLTMSSAGTVTIDYWACFGESSSAAADYTKTQAEEEE